VGWDATLFASSPKPASTVSVASPHCLQPCAQRVQSSVRTDGRASCNGRRRC
jgi:hypothetical protein